MFLLKNTILFITMTIVTNALTHTVGNLKTSITVNDALKIEGFTREPCADTSAIFKIIGEAIELGAPIYNAGLHIGCYRIYEGAAYKILYVYGSNCKDVEKILKTALERSHGDFSDTEKAWLMRVAFDKILGVQTTTGTTEESVPKNGYPQKG